MPLRYFFFCRSLNSLVQWHDQVPTLKSHKSYKLKLVNNICNNGTGSTIKSYLKQLLNLNPRIRKAIAFSFWGCSKYGRHWTKRTSLDECPRVGFTSEGPKFPVQFLGSYEEGANYYLYRYFVNAVQELETEL